MAKILITGGTGLVGRAISKRLMNEGYDVVVLSREAGETKGIKKYKWDVKSGYIDLNAFEGVEAVIHLAGSGIVDKSWTEAYKKEIRDSRVKSSELIFKTIQKNKIPIKTFIGGSAIGYYGSGMSDHVFKEEDEAGADFMGRVCVQWENSYKPFTEAGIRTCIIRTGIVLSKHGGAYPKMLLAFKWGLGSPFGSGKQYFPWIHLNDLAGIFIYALQHETLHGTFNAVGPEILTNKDFSQKLAKSLNRPYFMPAVPLFMLKMILGERVVTISTGLKISNKKIKEAGFVFEFEDVDAALKDLARS